MDIKEIRSSLQKLGYEVDEGTITKHLKASGIPLNEVTPQTLPIITDLFKDFKKGDLKPISEVAEALELAKETESDTGLTLSGRNYPAASSLTDVSAIDSIIAELEPESLKGDDALISYVCGLYDRRQAIVNDRLTLLQQIKTGMQAGQQRLNQDVIATLQEISEIPLQEERGFQQALSNLEVKADQTFRSLANTRDLKFAKLRKRFTAIA